MKIAASVMTILRNLITFSEILNNYFEEKNTIFIFQNLEAV